MCTNEEHKELNNNIHSCREIISGKGKNVLNNYFITNFQKIHIQNKQYKDVIAVM